MGKGSRVLVRLASGLLWISLASSAWADVAPPRPRPRPPLSPLTEPQRPRDGGREQQAAIVRVRETDPSLQKALGRIEGTWAMDLAWLRSKMPSDAGGEALAAQLAKTLGSTRFVFEGDQATITGPNMAQTSTMRVVKVDGEALLIEFVNEQGKSSTSLLRPMPDERLSLEGVDVTGPQLMLQRASAAKPGPQPGPEGAAAAPAGAGPKPAPPARGD